MAKGKGEENVQYEKIWAALKSGSETIIQRVIGSKAESSGNIFTFGLKKNEGRCWTEFYKYVKWRKGNRENIPAIKDHNVRLITQIQ